MELLDITTFTPIKTIDRRLSSTIFIDGASVTFYEKEVNGITISAGLHSLYGKNIYLAWGNKALDACTSHALLFTDPPVISPGCIDFTLNDSEVVFKEGEKTYAYPIV